MSDDERVAAVEILDDELHDVKALADYWAEELKGKPSVYTGVKVLELFVMDLIGRHSHEADIFSNQVNPFTDTVVVPWGLKCLAMSVLLMVNGYFIFSCMLYGKSQGLVWQRGWLIGSLVNLLLDIFIKQVNIVVVVYYFIPNMILQRALTAKQIIRKEISNICQLVNSFDRAADQNSQLAAATFSATDYLFVSTRVAKAFPNLLESAIVLSYRSPTVSSSQSREWGLSSTTRDRAAEDSLLAGLRSWITSMLLIFGGLSTSMQVLLISFNLTLITFTNNKP